MMTFEWTPERTARLKSLHSEGRSYTEIAAIIGCPTRSMVGGKVMRLRDSGEIDGPRGLRNSENLTRSGRERQSPGLAFVPVIKARLGEGKNDREIADEIGLKPDDVRYVRRVKKLKGNNLFQPPSYAKRLAELVLAGNNDRAVAAALHITLDQARYERRRQKLTVPVEKRQPVTNIVKGDPGPKVSRIFSEGFMGQKSRVALTELALQGMCRFPIDHADGPVRYCGDHCGEGQTYCAHHAARCFVAAQPKRPLRPSHVYQARR